MKNEKELKLMEDLRKVDEEAKSILSRMDRELNTLARAKKAEDGDDYYSKEELKEIKKQLQPLIEKNRKKLRDLKKVRVKITRTILKYATHRFDDAIKDQNRGRAIRAALNLMFENYQSTDLSTADVENRKKNYETLKQAVKYIVEEVMELTPEEYDAIYSNTLNQKAHIDYAIRRIVEGADRTTNRKAMFISKQTLFAIVWPEYYNLHYEEPNPWAIFNASGEIKSGLLRAGKPRNVRDEVEGVGLRQNKNGDFVEEPAKKRTVSNHGDEVDAIVYWAMKEVFEHIEIPTKDLFQSLADPKAFGWSKLGFVKIIAERKCYASPLDFYFLNSPPKWQEKYMYDYRDAREKANLEPIPILDYLFEKYEQAQAIKFGYKGKGTGSLGSLAKKVEEEEIER